MPTIRLENVTKTYWRARGAAAISEVSLTVEQGEFVFLVGSRGAGKSTLLSVLSGVKRPNGGRVLMDDEPLNFFSRARLRALVGRVDRRSPLLPQKTVRANLRPKNPFVRLEDRLDGEPVIEKALALVGMAGSADRRVRELSAADCHRVELAKAILHSPALLILDEITDKMDDDTIWDFLHLLSELNAHGTTVIMVTNAGRFINIMRKRVVTIADGRIVGDVRNGRYDTVLNRRAQ